MNNINNLRPFPRFCVTLGMLPTSYKESMTYEEQLLWLCNYIETEIIPKYNENVEAINELITLYNELKTYVDSYFDNLDVQEEINNKLDEMAESGELAEIVTAYLQVNGVLAFETISDLQSADNLIEGSVCKTLGYNSYNDGLGYLYRVRTYTSGDNIDELNIVSLINYPTLIAERIVDKNYKCYAKFNDMINDIKLLPNMYVKTAGYYSVGDGGASEYYIREKGDSETANNITTYELDNGLIAEIIDNSTELYAKKYGIKADSESDDATKLQALINYASTNNKDIIIDGFVYVSTTIDTKGVKIVGLGKRSGASLTYTSAQYGYIGWDYLRNVNNGALITFRDYVDDYLKTGSGIISDTANPILSVTGKTFQLENLVICGWLRNASQEGIRNYWDLEDVPTYIYGGHKLDNVTVMNCGSNGIHLTNLETTQLNGLKTTINFGYGIYLDGQDDIDTPTEYVRFENCDISGNKLGGIYINKRFNKQVVFENCNFTANGLYSQLNVSVPENKEDIVAGITINSYKVNQNMLEVNNCYAEQMNLLVKILTYNSGHAFNNIKITNNILYPVSNNSSILYIDNYYSGHFTMNKNFNNNGSLFSKSANSYEIIPFECDESVLNSITVLPTITYNANLNVTTEDIKRYGNLVYIRIVATATANINAWATLFENYPRPLNNTPILYRYGGNIKWSTIWTNKKTSVEDAITSGSSISFEGWYYIAPYSNRNGDY